MNVKKRTITWVTADYFIDVDMAIVPYLSKSFIIKWFIIGHIDQIEKGKLIDITLHTSVKVEFYIIQSKWYSPRNFLDFYSLFQKVKSEKSDIIYLDISSLLYPYVAADLILPKHNTVFATHNVKTPKGARFAPLAKANMYYLLHRFYNFQVFSINQKDFLQSKVFGKNLLFAPLALKDYGHSENYQNQFNQKIQFLSFGHIRGYKRIDLLINAAQKIYEETKLDFKVTIAGNCIDWSYYQSLIKYPFLFDLKIGFVKDDDIPLLFANSHYLVLPYQDLAQSGAITVAFNYNLPVITSDIPQFQEFVKEGINGFLFRSESETDLKEVMERCLFRSSDEYNKLKASVANYVAENYSLASICSRYIEYFNSLNLST